MTKKPNPEVKELQEKLEKTEEQLKRSVAELANFRRRTEEERADLICTSNAETIKKILPVLDNFELAFKNIPEDANTSWVQGFESIYNNLKTTLESLGLKKIETEGEDFDPEYHEALMQVPGEKEKVITELSPGYTLNNRVIRHAKVQIGNGE